MRRVPQHGGHRPWFGKKLINRREFISLLSGAAVAWPLSARAQQAGKTFHIGMVETISAELNAVNLAAFRRGLKDRGYVEGRNLVLSYRSADGDASRFPALISELIDSNVDLIVTRGTPAALAAKKATSTIPVVMAGLRRAAPRRCEPRSAGRQHYRPERIAAGVGSQTARIAHGDSSGEVGHRGPAEHEQSRHRAHS